MSGQPDLTQTVVMTVQHQNHSNQTYNHSQGSNDSPNNNLVSSADKIPSYMGGADSPFAHDSSPSYSLPELPNIYPQSSMDAGQYSVPDTQYNIYSPISPPQFPPQSQQSFSSVLSQPFSSAGPTPYSSTSTQQFFPDMSGAAGACGIPQRHSGNLAQVPLNKSIMIEPTVNHSLNATVEKIALKDSKSGLPPPPSISSCDSRPLSQCDSLQNSRQSVISVQLPGNVDTEAVTWSTFNHTGGRLILPESGMLLTFLLVLCVAGSFHPEGSSNTSRPRKNYSVLLRILEEVQKCKLFSRLAATELSGRAGLKKHCS